MGHLLGHLLRSGSCSEEQAAEPQESGGRAGLGGPKGRTRDGRQEAHTKADLNSIEVQLLAELSN